MTSDEGIKSDWRFLFSLIVELTLEGQPVSSADPTSWTYFFFGTKIVHWIIANERWGVAGTAFDVL